MSSDNVKIATVIPAKAGMTKIQSCRYFGNIINSSEPEVLKRC